MFAAQVADDDLLWLLQRMLVQPMVLCRQPGEDSSFSRHKSALTLVGALLTHRQTRMLAVNKLLFTDNRYGRGRAQHSLFDK